MNAEEQSIYDFLKGQSGNFVSVTDISKRLARGRQFEEDRNWARPVLRRMEMDGLLESNPFGEYRLLAGATSGGDTGVLAANGGGGGASEVDFKKALKTPGVSLADTTIIRLEDVQNADAAS